MALRLAGEMPSVVQGLDDQGWLQKTIEDMVVEKSLARLHLKDTQAGGYLGWRLEADAGYLIFKRGDSEYIYGQIEAGANVWDVRSLRPLQNDVHELGGDNYAWKYLYVRRLKNPGAGDGGAVFVEDKLIVLDHLRVGESIANYAALTRPMVNKNASRTMVSQEVVKLDTANDQAVVDTAGAADLNPFVVVEGGAAQTGITVAIGGVCLVDCDTGAVNRGDLLVSSAIALKAAVDNTVTDPRKIIGIALTSKGAGAAGSVAVLIRML